MIKLRNGSQVERSEAQEIIESLRFLRNHEPAAMHGLLMKCRDDNHKINRQCRHVLQALLFMDSSGRVDNDVRNVVLSAPEGNEIDMRSISLVA